MKREVKLKAYDTISKEIKKIEGFKYIGDKHIEIYYVDDQGRDITSGYHEDRIVIVMSTGLHDKKGTEIWEGDIVTNGTTKGREEYYKKFAEYQVIFEMGRQSLGCYMYHDDIEVIGNVYESCEDLYK